MEDMQLINFFMSRDTARRFRLRANELGMSRSALLRTLIDTFMAATETGQQ